MIMSNSIAAPSCPVSSHNRPKSDLSFIAGCHFYSTIKERNNMKQRSILTRGEDKSKLLKVS